MFIEHMPDARFRQWDTIDEIGSKNIESFLTEIIV